MQSEIYQFLETIKSEIEQNFDNLPVLVENQGDILFKSEESLKKQGIYVLIRVPTIENQGASKTDKLSLTLPNIMLQVSENVVINRSENNISSLNVYGISAQDTAIELAKFLAKNYSSVFTLSTIENDYEDNLMISTVTFETTVTLNL